MDLVKSPSRRSHSGRIYGDTETEITAIGMLFVRQEKVKGQHTYRINSGG